MPEFGKELSSESYILEYGFEKLNGVDFKKGCYVGQEVTARMKHKSKLRKGLTIVETTECVSFGTPISVNNKIIGKILSSSENQALAYLRFDFASKNMMAGQVKLFITLLDLSISLGPLRVFNRLCIHINFFALIDKRRHHDFKSIIQYSWLEAIGCSLTFNNRLSLNHNTSNLLW